jgi:N-acetylglucosamine-6-phosphate deacetylase
VAAAGARRVAAVTDAISASGLADGEHTLGGLDVDVRSGVARLAGNGALAGSTTTMDASLRQVVSWGVALPDALTMHSTTPALRLGVHEELAVGARADLVLLDAELRLQGVLTAGVAVPGLPLNAAWTGEPA